MVIGGLCPHPTKLLFSAVVANELSYNRGFLFG